MDCDPDKRECDGFSVQEYVKLKRENALAQTEIKGHMRVEDELKVEVANLRGMMDECHGWLEDARRKKAETQALLSDELLRRRNLGAQLEQAEVRIAELRDAYTELESDHKGMIDAWIDAEEREQKLKERVAELEKLLGEGRNYLEGLELADRIDAALKK
jgi:chromosome segregation ATPase